MVTYFTNFLLTQLIWSFTSGLSHLPISFILLFLLLKLWDHISLLRALILSFLLTVGGFIIFFTLVYGILVWGLSTPYILPEDTYHGSYDHLNTCLLLASIYSFIQVVILFFIKKWTHINRWRVMICIVCSQIMTALLVYKITFGL